MDRCTRVFIPVQPQLRDSPRGFTNFLFHKLGQLFVPRPTVWSKFALLSSGDEV